MSLKSYLMGHEVYLFISGTFKFESIRHNLRNSYHRFFWEKKKSTWVCPCRKQFVRKFSAKYGFKKNIKKL